MIPRRHDHVPPGTVPTCNLTDHDLRLCGLDPVAVRRLESELSEMGLGLGIKLPGFIKKIGKGIGKVGKAVGKTAFKAGKFAVKTGIKVAPIALPAAGILKFGPGIVRKVGGLVKRGAPRELPPGTPEPTVIDEPVMYRGGPAPILRYDPGEDPRAAFHRERLEAERRKRPSVLDTLKRIGQEVAPLVPQVIERITEREVAAPPMPYPAAPAAAPSVTVTTAGAGAGAGAPPAGMPGWLLPAAGIAMMMLMRGK